MPVVSVSIHISFSFNNLVTNFLIASSPIIASYLCSVLLIFLLTINCGNSFCSSKSLDSISPSFVTIDASKESLLLAFILLFFSLGTFTSLPKRSTCFSVAASVTTSNSLPNILLPSVLNSNKLNISVSAVTFFSDNL